MLKKLICSTFLAIFIFNYSVFAVGFLSSGQIEITGTKKYKAVKLTPQIYNNTNENLADIMIYDSKNEAVPYFINSYTENSSETKITYPMKLINSFTVDSTNEKFYGVDYTLVTPQKNDILATSIEVETDNKNFAKKLELLGSYDGNSWETVQSDILYDVDGNKKLEIFFSGAKKFTYYRFKMLNNLEQIAFSSVKLNFNNITKQKESFIATIYPQFNVEEVGKTTVIKISGLKHVKVDSITIETDSMFKRSVSFDGSVSKVLYNLSFKDIAYKNTTLSLNSNKITTDIAELRISNGDDKPIKINKIEVKYLQDELVFDGSMGTSYTIKFGNAETIFPPSYDIVNFENDIIAEGYDTLEIKDIKTQAPEAPKPIYDYKWIFNLVILLVALVMGIVIILKLKKN